MILTTLQINGQTIGVDLMGWTDDCLSGNTPFVVLFNSGDTIPNGYIDISSIENWDSIPVLDWSRRRDAISNLTYSIAGTGLTNYLSLTNKQRIIAAKYFLVPYQLRVNIGIFTDAQDKDNWKYLLQQTKQSREDCVEAMRLQVGEYIRTGTMTLAQTQQFYKDIYSFVIWFEQSNLPDLKQWISNEVGSPYETNGFVQTSYFNSTLRDQLMAIYNGNY
jgi:hypothetical protein